MKQYALFSFETYSCCGGWDDFHSAHDDPQEARAEGKRHVEEAKKPYPISHSWHVVDLTTGEAVLHSYDEDDD